MGSEMCIRDSTLIVVADGRAWAVYADGSGLSPLPALDGATSVAYRPATP